MRDQPSKSRELIILTEHFAPSTGATAQLVKDLADDLSCKGVALTVLTATPGYPGSSYPVHRISGVTSSSNGVFSKILSGLSFFLGSITWLLFKTSANHSLFIVSNPPFVGLIGPLLACTRKIRYEFLLQDIFPRSAVLTGILPSKGPVIWLWRSLMSFVVHKSACTVVLSQSMLTRCRKEFGETSKLFVIPNWTAVSSVRPICRSNTLSSSWGLDDIFTVQYSGNFGRLHDILTILEAARLLKGYPIKFLFIGNGAKYKQIRSYERSFSLDNILIKDYQPRELLAQSLATSDISIVSLIPGAEDTVAPSKLYGILASSRPVILISSNHSELADLITTSGCGEVFMPGDSVEMSKYILSLYDKTSDITSMSNMASKLYHDNYGRSKSTKNYLHLLKTLKLV